MASKPLEVKDDKLIVETDKSDVLMFAEDELPFVRNPYHMSIKMEFANHGHHKSGKYYLPEPPRASITGDVAELLVSHEMWSNI